MLLKSSAALAPPGMSITEAPAFAAFPLYDADIQNSTGFPDAVTAFADAIAAADGVIFCTPEYNFSVPGGLKNAIDWVSRLPKQPFAGKPVAIQSATPGALGGARVQYDLRRMLRYFDVQILGKPRSRRQLRHEIRRQDRRADGSDDSGFLKQSWRRSPISSRGTGRSARGPEALEESGLAGVRIRARLCSAHLMACWPSPPRPARGRSLPRAARPPRP
jgi:NAD(P)H-dependent FMN reductase